MAHRGPNDRGTHVSPGAAIGARRLSIVDVEGGHQPFANEDGSDLGGPERRALQPRRRSASDLRRRGHRFASRCDTEILPHLYEEYGPMFPERLRGMFGIAVWDRQRRRGVDRARPARDQAALLRRVRRPARVRLRAQEPAGERARPDRARLRGDRRVPDARLLPGARDAARGRQEARAGLPARRSRTARVEERRYWSYPEPTLERGGSVEEWSERLLAEARGVRPHAADERRPARRDAERRARLEPDRRADGAA